MAYKLYQMLLVSLCLTSARGDAHTAGCPDDPDVDLCDGEVVGPGTGGDGTTNGGGDVCVDDPELDLCDATPAPTPPTGTPTPTPSPAPTPTPTPTSDEVSGTVRQAGSAYGPLMVVMMALAMGRSAPGGDLLPFAMMFGVASAAATGGSSGTSATCGEMKAMYKGAGCCGNPAKDSMMQVVPMSKHFPGTNVCADKKPKAEYFDNVDCMKDGVFNSLEQSGTNITKGYKGEINATGRGPITTMYWEAGLCPVNVHWHLGTEHLSVGEFDENGKGPATRRLAADARLGFRCHHYDASDAKFTTEYNWQHCVGMHVGETYEVHWPHSAAGACGTPNQYQTPFYDGVFCTDGIVSLDPLNTYFKIGVQGQIYTIVNDESYFYPNLINGMIVDGDMGKDMSYYTGSTTGTTRDNQMCSRYTPITWQVDRKCHLISASTFDKMCADMKTMRDDMSGDLYAHGSRELVADKFAADNHQRRLVFADDDRL